MDTFIALLRGINVGGKNKLPMKDLVSLLEYIGLNSITTYIQSGNVIFKSKKAQMKDLAEKISLAIKKSHGFKPEVLILDSQTLARAVSENPFIESHEKALHYYFLAEPSIKPDLKELEAIALDSEHFELNGQVFYLNAPNGVGRSKLAAKIEKSLGVVVTARNARTINKLLSMTQS